MIQGKSGRRLEFPTGIPEEPTRLGIGAKQSVDEIGFHQIDACTADITCTIGLGNVWPSFARSQYFSFTSSSCRPTHYSPAASKTGPIRASN